MTPLRAILCAAIMALALKPATASARSAKSYDLVVYGATASGAAAAVAAARQGLNVVLVDPGHHVGGMVSGGLSHTDTGEKGVIGGISREFFERVGKKYGAAVEWDFEPRVAEQVFNEMLREAHVTTIFDHGLREENGVTKNASKIVAVTLDDGRVLRASVFIDASYEGDLMAQAKVTYTWGREDESQYGEALAGIRPPQRPDHNFNVRVSPFAVGGSFLPGVLAGPIGTIGQGDKKVQAYNFRMTFTDVKSNRIPYPKPEGYDPKRYALLKRLIAALAAANGRPPVMQELMIMSPVRGGKFDINSYGGFSTDNVGGSWRYPVAGYAERKRIWADHYAYEAGFFYFLANDPSVPKPLQDEVSQYGLAADEFVDNGGWPYQLYIREGRRMIGEYVMTQKDIQTEITKPDSIGMGSYQSDSHHVQRVSTEDGLVRNEGEMYVPTHPYEIPFRMMLPKASEASNLIVPVCFSASHVAYATLRMEPQYMILGEAAGMTAALAVRGRVPVSEVSVTKLQARLREQRAVLSLQN
jgi:hypothetical protein